VDNEIVLLSVSSGWMDSFEVLASGMIGSGGGGLGQCLLQLLELYRRCESIGRLAALFVSVVGTLDVSPNGDDTVRSWHLQKQISVMWNRHELGECRLSQESIICGLEIGNLKLQVLCAEVFPSPKGYGKGGLIDGSRHCSWDYAMERGLTGVQC
jgi:hypothetical protein